MKQAVVWEHVTHGLHDSSYESIKNDGTKGKHTKESRARVDRDTREMLIRTEKALLQEDSP
jgi:hypothetical protein